MDGRDRNYQRVATTRYYPPNIVEVDYLWIDQICIDQASVQERNHQVGMMGSIYSGCHETIIWLGNIHCDLDAPTALVGVDDLPVERDFHRVTSILGNEYFTRLWIVQEIMLSYEKEVLCNHSSAGPVWVSWWYLYHVARRVRYRVPSIPADHLLQDHLAGSWMTLFQAVRLFSQGRCQDPRDKVYGLMGLVTEEQRLTIDYAKSLEELLLDLMGIFYKDSTEEFSHSYTEYHSALVYLGTSWGIMSASLDAFLYDVWVKPTYNTYQFSGKDRPEPDSHHSIKAMGFCRKALDQDVGLKREELRPYTMNAERVLGYFEPNEWTPEKDCWWYEAYGTTYEIYGLVSSKPLQNESTTPGYYGFRVRKAHRGWKSRIQLPSWVASRRSK